MRDFTLPKKPEIEKALHAFTKKERVAFAILAVLLFGSSLAILESINTSLMVKVPLGGGSLSEGIVGTPRFINPVLASSSTDLDMVSLIYSGLMRKTDKGDLIPDLAEKYEAAENGLTYTFTLKDKAYFHNGKKVTADDVLFTVDRVKNSVITSPQKVHWEGITARKVDDRTIEFVLRQPNPHFLENATLGILPKALWENDSMELNETNTMPVGSGPYKIKSVSKESGGTINSYELASFDAFALGEPYIKEINFRFYSNEDALVRAFTAGDVDQISSVTPAVAKELADKGYNIRSAVLPRIFGLFLNYNQNQLFLDKTVTKAIADAIDKDRIVRDVLLGYGTAIDSPIPPSLRAPRTQAEKDTSRSEILDGVREALDKAGWKPGPDGFLMKTIADKNNKKTPTTLAFSISTSNTPELAQTAELIKEDLRAVGIKVDVKIFEVGNLNQNVIRPRNYDALLFGQVVENDSDLFAFWHSSQRKDPGLNIAMYTNAKVDDILESASVTLDEEARAKKYADFEAEIEKDRPAVFLYSPDFIYVVSDELQGLAMDHIANPADRFANVYAWFTKTEDVWKIFSKK